MYAIQHSCLLREFRNLGIFGNKYIKYKSANSLGADYKIFYTLCV